MNVVYIVMTEHGVLGVFTSVKKAHQASEDHCLRHRARKAPTYSSVSRRLREDGLMIYCREPTVMIRRFHVNSIAQE